MHSGQLHVAFKWKKSATKDDSQVWIKNAMWNETFNSILINGKYEFFIHKELKFFFFFKR